MKAVKYTIFCFLLVFLSNCNEIPVDLADPILPSSERVVLIEELSGASCPNCPKGSAAIDNILKRFPGKVAAVAIHGNFLSQPTARSKFDFRNPAARELESWFRPWFGKPSASINRVPDENDFLMIGIPELWQAAVERELQKDHVLNLQSKTTFDPNTQEVNIDLAAIPLIDLSGNHKISIYLTESGIIDAQTNGSVIIDNYEHKHVLRDMVTRFDGENFVSDMKKNDIIRRNYTYTIPKTTNGLWDPKRLEVIIAIHKDQGKDKAILQAFYSKLVP